MAKLKLSLGRLPSFKLPVKFNLIDGSEVEVVFIAKHLKASELQEFYTRDNENKDTDFLMFICEGWNLEEEFNEENVKEFIELFPSAILPLNQQYMLALTGNRAKN